MESDPLVWVRRHPKDWRQAAYRLADIDDLYQDDERVTQALTELYGYAWCQARQDGESLHFCSKSAEPHRIRVCIMKKDNEQVFGGLVALAFATSKPTTRALLAANPDASNTEAGKAAAPNASGRPRADPPPPLKSGVSGSRASPPRPRTSGN
jgi:hypothetical protein